MLSTVQAERPRAAGSGERGLHLQDPASTGPLLDQFLAPLRGERRSPAEHATPRRTQHQRPAPGDREKTISQIPPKSAEHPGRAASMEGPRRASDLVRQKFRSGGANETRTRDPLLAKQVLFQLSYSPNAAWAAPSGYLGSRAGGGRPTSSEPVPCRRSRSAARRLHTAVSNLSECPCKKLSGCPVKLSSLW